METFMWAMVVLLGLESLGYLASLALNDIPERTPAHVVANIVLNAIILVWALVVLID